MKKPSAIAWVVAAVTLAFGLGAGRCTYFALYRARCGATAIKMQTGVVEVSRCISNRHAAGKPPQHAIEVLLEDCSRWLDDFYEPFCIEGSPRDAKIGRFTLADFKAGRVSKEALLDEASRTAGSMPRWDRLGAYAFLMTEEPLADDALLPVGIGSVVHHHYGGNWVIVAFADGHVEGLVLPEHFEWWLNRLDELNLPRPPEEIWKPYVYAP